MYKSLSKIPGLNPVVPSGAMYMMVRPLLLLYIFCHCVHAKILNLIYFKQPFLIFFVQSIMLIASSHMSKLTQKIWTKFV